MKRTRGLFIRMAVLGTAAAAAAALLVGCGGGSTTPFTSTADTFKQTGATYVGTAVCSNCHHTIYTEYTTADNTENLQMGRENIEGGVLLKMDDATQPACYSCHATGYGHDGGYNPAAPNPALYGNGCENCHGPGSKHVSAGTLQERLANITRVPPAKEACWGCHGGYKTVNGFNVPGAIFDPAPVANDTASGIYDKAPGKVAVPHHPAAGVLLGRFGYNFSEDMPSPHATLQNTCLNCHAPGAAAPDSGHQIEHGTTQMLPPNLDRTRAQCAACHAGREAGDTSLQAGIKAQLIQIGGIEAGTTDEPADHLNAGDDSMLSQYVRYYNIDTTTNNAKDDPHVINYKAARYEYFVVRRDGSWGVHNPQYSEHMLEDAIQRLTLPPT